MWYIFTCQISWKKTTIGMKCSKRITLQKSFAMNETAWVAFLSNVFVKICTLQVLLCCNINTYKHTIKSWLNKAYLIFISEYVDIYLAIIKVKKPCDFHPIVLLLHSQHGRYWEWVLTNLHKDNLDYLLGTVQLLISTFFKDSVFELSNRVFSEERVQSFVRFWPHGSLQI